MILYNNEDGSSNGGNGNKSKFNERLNKIRKDRLRFRKSDFVKDDDELGIITFGRNLIKIVLALPSFIYSHVFINDKKHNSKKIDLQSVEDDELIKILNDNNNMGFDLQSLEDDELIKILNFNNSKLVDDDIRKLKVKKIKNINISLLKRKREDLVKSTNFNSNKDLDIEKKKIRLQKEIVDLIKKRLVKNINEFEILKSELYVLTELGFENIYLIECEEDIKEIRKLLSKVKSLKDKYDYLKDNVDFQYMLEYDDNFLIDKILELKDICYRDDIKHTIDDYKILEEYKYLYLKIDKLQDDMIKFEDEKNKKAMELKQRDLDFEKFKNNIYNVDVEKDKYDSFVKEQEKFLNELDEEISKIDSYERINYRLKGFNKLLGNSFKYLGLLLINPLKGLIPGIATQTLITKNLVHNLYNNLYWEEDRKMVYEAIDYSKSINNTINNLNDTSLLVDSTLDEIVLLKNKYKEDFSKYGNNISSYNDIMHKLNKIENAVLGNKIKIEIMKSRMKEKELINNNKLKLVKNLNKN